MRVRLHSLAPIPADPLNQLCGGTEYTFWALSEALRQRGHDVTLTSGPFTAEDRELDVFITQDASIYQLQPAKRYVWWCHHFPDQQLIKVNACWARAYDAKVVTLSEVQARAFEDELRLPSVVIPHGCSRKPVDRTHHGYDWLKKDPAIRMVYASAPFRGLDRIPGILDEMTRQGLLWVLDVYGGLGLYGQDNSPYQPLYEQLASMGARIHGPMSRYDMWHLMAGSTVLLYPSTWAETYCCVLDEALACGLAPAVSNMGALPERVSPAIPADASPAEWVAHIQRVASGDYAYRKPMSWDEVAQGWEAILSV